MSAPTRLSRPPSENSILPRRWVNEGKKRTTRLSCLKQTSLAAYELVQNVAGARHPVDRVNPGATHHQVPRTVACGANVIVARTRIDAVHPFASGNVVVAAIAAYEVRPRGPGELVRAVIAVDGARKGYPAGQHQRQDR
jgi:hypothetical protein